MGRHLNYRPGSFYRVDDRTGFAQRAERTEKEWDGGIVDRDRWEARQPQDLVRGVKDIQGVPEARPLSPDLYVGPYITTTTANAAVKATLLHVESVGPIKVGDAVRVMLDTGAAFQTTVNALGAGTITLAVPIPYAASSGAQVCDIDPGGQYGFSINGAQAR